MSPKQKPKTTVTGRTPREPALQRLPPRDEKPKLRTFLASYRISGEGTAEVRATSLDEARKKAKALDIVDGSDRLIEWSFEDLRAVEEND